MSAEFISRIVGMVVLAIAGVFSGIALAYRLEVAPYQYAAVCLLVGALTGLVITPYVTVRPFTAPRHPPKPIALE